MISFSGIAFLFIAVGIPFLSPDVRHSPNILRATILVLVVRQLITFLQITVGPLPTVDRDPIAFNAFAMSIGAEYLAGNTFVQVLRFLYETLGGSHLLGCEVNQIGFSVALLAFVELLVLLDCQAVAPRLVLLFGLLPSVLLNTSVVLREGPQMAAFMTLCLEVVRVRRMGVTLRTGLVPFACLVLLYLQQGFAPYLILVLPFAILWVARARPWLFVSLAALGLFVGTFFAGTILSKLSQVSDVMSRASQGTALEYIENYQGTVERGRSDFETRLELGSVYGLLSTGPIVAAQYLFSPFPWQIRGTKDLYGLVESSLRVILFVFALLELARASGEKKQDEVFLMAMFLSLELVWAAGTANWGTAFRHRVVAWGLLVALGGPRLFGEVGLSDSQAKDETLGARRLSIRERRRQLASARARAGDEVARPRRARRRGRDA